MPRFTSPTMLLPLPPRVLRSTLRVLYREKLRLERQIRRIEEGRRGFVRLGVLRP